MSVREILGLVRDFLSYWLREIAGWLLVLAGLVVLYDSIQKLGQSRPIEAGPLMVIGVVMFRGGIHLLKVGVAARICSQARKRAEEDPPRPPSRRPTAKATPLLSPVGEGQQPAFRRTSSQGS